MDYILNIHTATETAMVSVCHYNKVLDTLTNSDPKQHASFLHRAIQKILLKNDIQINELKAIGVSIGPGSYTGIRVGLATAKGLAFSLKIPHITFNTLEIMALSATENIQDKNALYCPMIDARRMEVFTAVYNYSLQEVKPPSAMVLTESSFADLIRLQPIYFFGSGSEKFKDIALKSSSVHFSKEEITSTALCNHAWEKYQDQKFDDIAYSEALYVKEFHSTIKK